MATLLAALTTGYFLVAARVLGLMVTAPVWSSVYIPVTVRIAIGIVLAYALTPLVHPVTGGTVAVGLGIVVQFAIGALMGLVLAIFLSLFGMAGQLITYQMGIGLAAVSAPGVISGGSILAEWNTLLALYVFVAGGGLELTMKALYYSFHAISANALTLGLNPVGFVIGLMTTAFMMTVLIAAPMLLAGLAVNLVVGILSRSFPQINAFLLAMPANAGVSLFVLFLTLPVFFVVTPEIWHHAWTDISRLMARWPGVTP